jgi:hypothetical protein
MRRPKIPDPGSPDTTSSPPLGASPGGGGGAVGIPHHHPPLSNKPESIDDGKKTIVGPMPPPPTVLASFGEGAVGGQQTTFKFVAEPLDKFLENKVFREKRQQLDKKMDDLRKKHEKDRKLSKPPKKSHRSLVKKLSSKNLYVVLCIFYRVIQRD